MALPAGRQSAIGAQDTRRGRQIRPAWRVPALLLAAALCCLCGCMDPGPRALLKGDKLLHEGKYDQAIEHLQRAVRLLPKNAQAFNLLGLAYHAKHQSESAQRAYHQALILDNNLAAARYNLGCLLLERNDLQAAIDQLTSYTYLQPNSGEGWLKLGSAQLRARRTDAAEKSLKLAVDLQPHNPAAWNSLGTVLFQRQRMQEALNCFQQALAQNSHFAPALLNAAIVAHHSLNNRSMALQLYRRYLALEPRPASWDAVNATANQLEIELNPPPLPLVPATLPPHPAPRTNLQLVAARPAEHSSEPARQHSNPPPAHALPAPARSNVAAPNLTRPAAPPSPMLTHTEPVLVPAPAKPPTPEPVKPAPPPEIEVTHIPEDLVVNPPQEIMPIVQLPASSPALNTDAVAKPVALPPSTPVAPAAPKPEPRRWFSRLNPFRSKAKPPTNNLTLFTPAADPSQPLKETPKVTQSAPVPASAPPSSPPPNFTRYVYLSPAKPARGNRAEAERDFAEGLKAQRLGQAEQAFAYYQRATQLDPSYFEAQYNRGLAAYESEDWSQSLQAYELALALNPDSVDARYNFALALKQANYPQDAANELRRILDARPKESRAHLSLANLCAHQLQNPKLAREHFLKLLELEPHHPQAMEIRYWLAAQAKTEGQSTQ